MITSMTVKGKVKLADGEHEIDHKINSKTYRTGIYIIVWDNLHGGPISQFCTRDRKSADKWFLKTKAAFEKDGLTVVVTEVPDDTEKVDNENQQNPRSN